MLVCVAGDTHGELDRLYEIVDALERRAERAVDAVLQVGDFGVWPDPNRLDEATRRHGDRGEFRRLQALGAVPRPTYFIAGNHEDFAFLTAADPRALPTGLHFVRWGEVVELVAGGERLRVGGVGGCFGPRDYERASLAGAARRHYTRADLDRLARTGTGIDVLLLHEPPAGVVTELHAPPGMSPRTWTLKGQGLAELVAQIKPRICFSGHIHARTERRINGVRTLGLHKVPHRGSVLLLDIPAGAGEPVDLAEWGGSPTEVVVRDTWQAVRVVDPATTEALARALEAWANLVIAGRTLDRAGRKLIHAALAGNPQRAALMGALNGRDPFDVIEDIEPDEREALLAAWTSGALPDPSALRPD